MVVASLLLAGAAIAGFYVLLPQLAGLRETWQRIDRGDPSWLGLAVACEALSFAAYIVLFRAVFADEDGRIDWRASYQITMAGLAATRLFALAGIGGIVLTTWALRGSGMTRRGVIRRMTAYLVLLYGIFMISMIVSGLGLRLGVFAGPAPFGLTVVPATFAAAVVLLTLSLTVLPGDLEQRIRRRLLRSRWSERWRWRSSPSSPIARSPSGCRPSPG